MDCIILVGNREDYRVVANDDNKAFLKIGDRFILQIMLDELAAVAEIGRILLVGPSKRLHSFIASTYGDSYPKTIGVFEQGNDLLENALMPVSATATAGEDRHVLYLPCDIPLLTAEEVREFIALADMQHYDFVSGLVSESTLLPFAPSAGLPGISMVCFHLSCDSYRPNNMHMVRPSALNNIDYIRRLYGMRYQKKFINGLKLTCLLLTTPLGLHGLIYYGRLSLAIQCRRRGWMRCARWFERRITRERGEWGISKVLGARFKTVVTSYGGTTIDVDNETDYRTVNRRHSEWLSLLKAIKPRS